MFKALSILFFLAISLKGSSQVFPVEGSAVNYRIVGFSYQQLPKAAEYKIEIAKGSYSKADSFKRNIINSVVTKEQRKILEVPVFGEQYTWRVVYGSKQKKDSTPLYHFRTRAHEHVDTNKLHLRILQPAAKQISKDYYVAVDAGGVIYDLMGNPVWFIPDTNGIGGYVGALKFTKDSTITFLYGKINCEINYNADILWKTPNTGKVSGDTLGGELYHHEFTKLSNGHFMGLGTQMFASKQIITPDTTFFAFANIRDSIGKNNYKIGKYGTIIEYDQQGNVVWSWKTLDYLMGTDFSYYRSSDSERRFDAHDNAFFFDEKNKCIYLGFRNLSRILKIDYPSGKVLATYGEIFKPGTVSTATGVLCNQHSINKTKEGYLYIFNNHSCTGRDSLPTVVILKEPEAPGGSFKKIWEYTCTIDTLYPPYTPKIFASGGNAVELPDNSFFVCMGGAYSKMFIVTRDKKILWNALPERFMESDNKWTNSHEYRVNIISRKDLEGLIWKAENTILPVK